MSSPLTIYQVDAFTSTLFKGNPAAVVPLTEWPEDELLQKIARENNLSETAFFVTEEKGYRLRWFTPALEVDLCGHATLATEHVLFHHLKYTKEEVRFYTRSGELSVSRTPEGYLLDFPSDPGKPYPLEKLPVHIMGTVPCEIIDASYLLTVYPDEDTVANLKPDFRSMADLPWLGIIATAPANDKRLDFVSRFYCPKAGIDEDPVTGSAHTILTPYWSARLGKNTLQARQISPRGGEIGCELSQGRVLLYGQAVTYLTGQLHIS